MNSNKTGFTLIELLVVVAIISLLSSVVLATLADARERAALTQMRQTADQIRSAIELYRSDNGVYPSSVTAQIWADPVDEISSFEPIKQYIKDIRITQKSIRSFNFSNPAGTPNTTGILYRNWTTYDTSPANQRSCANLATGQLVQWVIWFNITESNPSQSLIDKLQKYGFYRYVKGDGSPVTNSGSYFCLTHAPI